VIVAKVERHSYGVPIRRTNRVSTAGEARTIDPLATRKLGPAPLRVTQLGFGGAPLGDIYARLDEDHALGAVAAAHDAGVTLFDTSPLYGYGLSEHRIGQVLRRRPRDSFVLSTKVGRWLRPEDPTRIDRGQWQGGLDFQPMFDYGYDGALKALDQSIQRLGLSRIDVVLIHDVDVWTHGTREACDARFKEAMDGAYRALDELRAAGTIRAVGVGVNEADMCARFARAGDFDCMLLAGRYTLLEQGALDEFLPLSIEKNIGLMIGGAFNSGILATGSRPGAKYNYQDAPPQILDRVRRIERVCEAHRVPLPAAAIQFPLGHEMVTSVVIGAVSAAEVERNLEAMRVAIPAGLWDDLKAEGLLRGDAPSPAG
jgi:D-threo-aldose 1-dehydrogenase